jgi:DNA-binding transcriptional MerR regulator
MAGRKRDHDLDSVRWRIGEVTKLTGVTGRTLRYWEEQGLLQPESKGSRGDRLYSPADVARVGRISDLQELLGFSLAEVRAVLDTEDIDVLDRVRSELRGGDPGPQRRKELIDEAIVANDQLLVRLTETLARIQTFHDERAAAGGRLRRARAALKDEPSSTQSSSRKR